MKTLCIKFVRLYQLALSPWLGGRCRFYPSCSEYALEALELHSWHKAVRLSLFRILRCHPFSTGGHDPVPQIMGHDETIPTRGCIEDKTSCDKRCIGR